MPQFYPLLFCNCSTRLNHIAVIVAEDVTSRFLNVITLLAGSIPLIAIQIHGLQVGEAFTLVATRVVDMTAGQPDEDDDGGDPVDRTSWERRSSRGSLETLDRIMELVNEVQPGTAATYKKHYIGLATNGMARNFMQFWPRKTTVVAGFRMDESEDMSHWIDEIGLTIHNLPAIQRPAPVPHPEGRRGRAPGGTTPADPEGERGIGNKSCGQ